MRRFKVLEHPPCAGQRMPLQLIAVAKLPPIGISKWMLTQGQPFVQHRYNSAGRRIIGIVGILIKPTCLGFHSGAAALV